MSYHSNSPTSQIRFATRAPSIISSSNAPDDVLAEEYGPQAQCDMADGGQPMDAGDGHVSTIQPGLAHEPESGADGMRDDVLTFDLDIDFDSTPGTQSPPPIFLSPPEAVPERDEQHGFIQDISSVDAIAEGETGELVPISLASDRNTQGASKFAQAVARYRAQGFDFFQIAGKLMLSVLKKKEALLPSLSEIDGSWQASAAWIADMIKEEETRDPVIDALFLLMDGERIKGRPELIERHDEILAACARIRASGRHRRDQIIMRLGSVKDEVGVVFEKHTGAARLCVPIVMHAEEKEIGEPFVFVAHPMSGFQRNLKKTLLAMGDFGRNKIAWHQSEAIEALFKRMQARVLADERIQEVVFYWHTEGERRIALAFMNILSTLWNVPAFGRGEMDFVYMESARMAAIRMAKG